MRFPTSRPTRRLLIVEDDDNAALLLESILEPEPGTRVVGRARHGREALTMAAALNPDLILMDLNMPIMDGVEAIRKLRAVGSKARIIVTTGVDDAAMLHEARLAGADAVLAKPPTRDDLLAAIGPASRRR
jgi:CheY-like chemotaxis protein